MALYKNIVQYDWNLEARPEDTGGTGLTPPGPFPQSPQNHPTVGEFVSFIKYPFGEYDLYPILKIKQIYDDFKADLEVWYSNTIPPGTIYLKQPLEGLRRVKLSSLQEITSSAFSASSISPQPTPIQILIYS